MVGTWLTIQKEAKRTPDIIVETTIKHRSTVSELLIIDWFYTGILGLAFIHLFATK